MTKGPSQAHGSLWLLTLPMFFPCSAHSVHLTWAQEFSPRMNQSGLPSFSWGTHFLNQLLFPQGRPRKHSETSQKNLIPKFTATSAEESTSQGIPPLALPWENSLGLGNVPSVMTSITLWPPEERTSTPKSHCSEPCVDSLEMSSGVSQGICPSLLSPD